jgi:peptide-methionine (S)-S-oxide reductase
MNVVTGIAFPTHIIVRAKEKIKKLLVQSKRSIMGQVKSSLSSGASRVSFSAAAPAAPSAEPLSNRLALGAGCYWGTEKYVQKDFQKKFPNSIKSCAVGFMSPEANPRYKNPTYQQVCTGASGHIEVLYVELNEPEKHFEELMRFFFQFHDPTTRNRQGNDSGFQYASWIFCGDSAQISIATKVRSELQAAIDAGAVTCYTSRNITTQITPLTEFTKASADHQRYLEKNPNGYCNHRIRLKEWVEVDKTTTPSSNKE